ncbi:hypothetical protein M271_49865 [Streptomyces rapamycinicus NRRL 5491]|nr:hypothetical protein M271_49865 [Streptomyces rapamycinicus NRRL 5491]
MRLLGPALPAAGFIRGAGNSHRARRLGSQVQVESIHQAGAAQDVAFVGGEV